MTPSRIVAPLIAAAVAFGVGYAVAPEGTTVVKRPVVQKVVTGIPPARIAVPKQSAVHPDGYTPKAPPPSSPFRATGGQHASTHGLHLIEGFEGFSSCSYFDPFGRVWTRGYGETEGITSGSPCISRSFGETNLASRLRRFYDFSIRDLGVRLNQNQFDALDSFVWNLGAGIFTGSLRADLTSRRFFAASRIMLQYDHAGGQVLEGLRIRRQAEVRLFLTPAHEESRAEHLHRQLVAARSSIGSIRFKLQVHRCRVIHGPHAFRGCPQLAHEGRVAHQTERRLLREGAR